MLSKTHDSNFTLTPGQLLMAAREARSFTQADIAKQTRLSVQAIHDIEQDSYSQLGVRTFVRGYLCAYARLVGIPESQILEALEASGLMPDLAAKPGIVEGAPITNVTRQYARFQLSGRWVATGVGGLVVIIAVAFFQGKKEPVDVLASNAPSKPVVVIESKAKSAEAETSANNENTLGTTATKASLALNKSKTTSLVAQSATILKDQEPKDPDDASSDPTEDDRINASNTKNPIYPATSKNAQLAKKSVAPNEVRIKPSDLAQSHTTYTVSTVAPDQSATKTS